MDSSKFNDHNFLDITRINLPRKKDYANALLIALSQLKTVKCFASDWENGAALRAAVYKQKSEVEELLFGTPGKIWVIEREFHDDSPNFVYLRWISNKNELTELTDRSPNSILNLGDSETPEIVSLKKGV